MRASFHWYIGYCIEWHVPSRKLIKCLTNLKFILRTIKFFGIIIEWSDFIGISDILDTVCYCETLSCLFETSPRLPVRVEYVSELFFFSFVWNSYHYFSNRIKITPYNIIYLPVKVPSKLVQPCRRLAGTNRSYVYFYTFASSKTLLFLHYKQTVQFNSFVSKIYCCARKILVGFPRGAQVVWWKRKWPWQLAREHLPICHSGTAPLYASLLLISCRLNGTDGYMRSTLNLHNSTEIWELFKY